MEGHYREKLLQSYSKTFAQKQTGKMLCDETQVVWEDHIALHDITYPNH